MLSIVIPAFNESARIAQTVAAARDLDPCSQIIVVDDGSTDDTAARAETAGADIVLKRAHAGKGAALQAGYLLAVGKVMLLLDADLGDSAREAAALLGPVQSGVADMTIAAFPVMRGSGGGMGLVVRLARWGIRRLTGRTMQAPLSGQRAVRCEVVTAIGGFAPGWGAEIALTVQALRAGYRVLEVPTAMTHRVTGRAPGAILHRARQFYAAARVLLRLWRHPNIAPERHLPSGQGSSPE